MNFQTYKDHWENIIINKNITLPETQKASATDLEKVSTLYQNIPTLLMDWWEQADGTKIDVTFMSVFSDEYTPCNFFSIKESLEFLDYFRNDKDTWEEFPQKSTRDERIKDGWLNDNWLPIAGYNGTATIVMIDNDPTSKGQLGQVIVFQHDPDGIYYVAKYFSDFLEKSLALLSKNIDHI